MNRRALSLLMCILTVFFSGSLLASASKPEYQVLLDAAKDARRHYDINRLQMSARNARQRYVSALVDIAYEYIDLTLTGNNAESQKGQPGWEALNREIMRYPAPKDSKGLAKLRVGKWESPRHDYIFYSNGRWSIFPLEKGVTNGHWKITGNQYLEGPAVMEDGTVMAMIPYTIILLNEHFFVINNSRKVCFETRLTR